MRHVHVTRTCAAQGVGKKSAKGNLDLHHTEGPEVWKEDLKACAQPWTAPDIHHCVQICEVAVPNSGTSIGSFWPGTGTELP